MTSQPNPAPPPVKCPKCGRSNVTAWCATCDGARPTSPPLPSLVYTAQTAELSRLRHEAALWASARERIAELEQQVERLREENGFLRGVVERSICHPEDVPELERRGIDWC